RIMPLIGAFESQIAAKRYDVAAAARRRANATFLDPHAADQSTALEYAMDLTPLVRDPTLDIARWTLQFVERFARDVEARLSLWKYSPCPLGGMPASPRRPSSRGWWRPSRTRFWASPPAPPSSRYTTNSRGSTSRASRRSTSMSTSA